tara:strand:+ start:261 stop:419 length:159 start_codon:yes stop_codon:yes gene_type:complete
MEENIVYELLENGENLIMIPSDPNLFILELWEIVVGSCAILLVGIAIGHLCN